MRPWPKPVVSIVGWHNSGKTSVATALVRILKRRGFGVAAIKHSREDVELDREGTDTALLAEAGADVVAISSAHCLAFLERPRVEVPLAEIIARLPAGIDLVIAEGFKAEDAPKIEVIREGSGQERIIAPGELLAVVTDGAVSEGVPVFGPNQMEALAQLLIDRLVTGCGPGDGPARPD